MCQDANVKAGAQARFSTPVASSLWFGDLSMVH